MPRKTLIFQGSKREPSRIIISPAFTLITTFLIGYVTDRFSFQPVVIAASIMPCVATILFVTMVRAGKRDDPDKVLLQF